MFLWAIVFWTNVDPCSAMPVTYGTCAFYKYLLLTKENGDKLCYIFVLHIG